MIQYLTLHVIELDTMLGVSVQKIDMTDRVLDEGPITVPFSITRVRPLQSYEKTKA